MLRRGVDCPCQTDPSLDAKETEVSTCSTRTTPRRGLPSVLRTGQFPSLQLKRRTEVSSSRSARDTLSGGKKMRTFSRISQFKLLEVGLEGTGVQDGLVSSLVKRGSENDVGPDRVAEEPG